MSFSAEIKVSRENAMINKDYSQPYKTWRRQGDKLLTKVNRIRNTLQM